MVDENESGSHGFFDRLHDSWNAFPTFVLIDHTMTVRAKPWTLDSNSNTNHVMEVTLQLMDGVVVTL